MTAVERALARAQSVLAVYAGDDDPDEEIDATLVQDLITDLRHYYASCGFEHNMPWDRLVQLVDMHFEAEQAGEDD